MKVFYCPANRSAGGIDLAPDRGAVGLLPAAVRGRCGLRLLQGGERGARAGSGEGPAGRSRAVRHCHPRRRGHGHRDDSDSSTSTDGTSTTIALGEAAGGSIRSSRSATWTTRADSRRSVHRSAGDAGTVAGAQPGSATGRIRGTPACWRSPPSSGCRLTPQDEPLNRSPGTPSIYGYDPSGFNRRGLDWSAGSAASHPGGCNFVFCDGSVRWVREAIEPATYRALSTHAGGEVIAGDHGDGTAT